MPEGWPPRCRPPSAATWSASCSTSADRAAPAAEQPAPPFARAGRVPLRPRAAPPRALAELAAPGQPRPGLRLLRQGGRVLPRRSPRPPLLPPFPGLDGGKLGHWGNQNERPGPTAAGTRPTSARCSAASSGRGGDRAQGRLRPARRPRRAGRLLQPRDALLRGRLERRLRQVLGRRATASSTA